MANNKTILKAIERCDRRIARARNKERWAKSPHDRKTATEAIQEQESKKLRLQQQMILNGG